jgi:hypothetical protein
MITMETVRYEGSHEIIKEISCDICHSKAKHPHASSPWSEGRADVKEVQISYESGERYPESSATEKEQYDICPACWSLHIVPFLKSLGAEPRKIDLGW